MRPFSHEKNQSLEWVPKISEEKRKEFGYLNCPSEFFSDMFRTPQSSMRSDKNWVSICLKVQNHSLFLNRKSCWNDSHSHPNSKDRLCAWLSIVKRSDMFTAYQMKVLVKWNRDPFSHETSAKVLDDIQDFDFVHGAPLVMEKGAGSKRC
jgi:hypothetical protein